jgi:hypothetical protein
MVPGILKRSKYSPSPSLLGHRSHVSPSELKELQGMTEGIQKLSRHFVNDDNAHDRRIADNMVANVFDNRLNVNDDSLPQRRTTPHAKKKRGVSFPWTSDASRTIAPGKYGGTKRFRRHRRGVTNKKRRLQHV